MTIAPASHASSWHERALRGVIRLAAWTGVWLLSLALAKYGPAGIWESGRASLLAIIANLAIGLGMIRANIQYLDTLDELMRRVQLEAMALSLGIGVVAGLGYSLLESARLIAVEADIAFLVGLMGITYLACSLVGWLKYR